MNNIEENLRLLLDGLTGEQLNIACDFSLDNLNENSQIKNKKAKERLEFKPVVKRTVCYIVAAVLFNENGDVLMMQEAKQSCRGKWYLPAGRMEPGEDIGEAAKREVKEETGLEFEPTTLLMVESSSGAWYRFVLTGNIVGGKLKTPEDADEEALQATWAPDLNKLPLRGKDILPLIEIGRRYRMATIDQVPWHKAILPCLRPHHALLIRAVIVGISKTSNRVNVIFSEENLHLPVCEINPMTSVWSTFTHFIVSVFGVEVPKHSTHGLLAVEHTGHPKELNDGFCFTLLVSIKEPVESVNITEKYSWMELNQEFGSELLGRLQKNKTVPLVVLR